MKEVNEGTTAYMTVVCKNKAGVAEAPASAAYWIDDLGSGERVREETSLTPGLSMEIQLAPTDNRIVDDTRGSEIRRVTVRAAYGANDALKGVYLYKVKNLSGVSGE